MKGFYPLSELCFTGGALRQTWIDLCQKASVDPRELTNKRLDDVLKLVLAASTMDASLFFVSHDN